jgi:SAM-dependent methyltransferase
MSFRESYLPSIWMAEFGSKDAFDSGFSNLSAQLKVMGSIDDGMIRSRHPFDLKAWCSSCGEVTEMRVDWRFSGTGNDGSVHPAWTETCTCSQCRLNSRMRALIDCIVNKLKLSRDSQIYMAEQVTSSYKVMKRLFKSVSGSEYLGENYRSGEKALAVKGHFRVRHEDLCALSFAEKSFDAVISQDVFEHIPDYRRAISESFRVLKPDGLLVFTIPFFYDLSTTRVRAKVNAKGEVEHIFPPEFHGNPVSNDGALCFQNFGWDLLDELKAAGFSQSVARMYWGPWAGHLGSPFFVFTAFKG